MASRLKSFSVQRDYVDAKVPETGTEVFQSLTVGQKKLLEDSKVAIDWSRVQRIANIQSTSWKTNAKGELGKLSVELWEWPGGSILEVSTKVAPAAGQSTYSGLKLLAKRQGLAVSRDRTVQDSDCLGRDCCGAFENNELVAFQFCE